MGRAAFIISAALFAVMIFVCVIICAVYFVTTPFASNSMVVLSQRDTMLPLHERSGIASVTTQYVRNGSYADEIVGQYLQDKVSGDESVQHLYDVRAVFVQLWNVARVLLVILVLLLTSSFWFKWGRWIRLSTRMASWMCLVLPVLVGFIVLVAFGPLFHLFHKILFPQGNWQFPSDSLLIQVFPQLFWVVSALFLLAFILIVGVLFRLLTLKSSESKS